MVLAAWVYHPITANYFFADDFVWLLAIANDRLLHVLLRPYAGHNLFVRNLVFYGCYRLFGLHAEFFFWTVLLVHLTNVWLLFRVLRTVTSSLTLASFGATLWGTSPLISGTLDWYSAFGHALVGTCLLVVLEGVTRRARTGQPVYPRAAWSWYGLLLAGTTCFGIGIGVALVFPAILFLLFPSSWHQRWVRAAYLLLPIVTVALFIALRRLSGVLEPPMAWEPGMEVVSLSRLTLALRLAVQLLVFGVAGTTSSFFVSPGNSSVAARLLPIALSAGLALVLWRGHGTGRRTVVAMAVLCLGAYFAVGWGRGMFAATPQSMEYLSSTSRYHYVSSMAIVITICLSLQELGRLPGLHAIPRVALLVAALAAGAYAFHTSGFHVSDSSWCRREFEAARDAVVADVRRGTASESITYLDNGKDVPRFLGPIPFRPWFPGRAALFVVGAHGESSHGHAVRFVEGDPAVVGWYSRWPGTPLAELLVSPKALGSPPR
jgi:hypothetical protein